MALVMRIQLAVPDNKLLGPDRYNQMFSMHGSAMMFLFAVPVMEAIGVYLVPLMVGARNIAFPRLNAFSYWIYLFGGIMIFLAFVLDIGPEAGWFAYVPLSGPDFSPGKRTDIWAQMITFTEVAALCVAVGTGRDDPVKHARAGHDAATASRCSSGRCWFTAFMVIFAMPSVMLGQHAC